MAKIKFIIETSGEGMKFGFTDTPLYVYGNINKVIGLWDIIKEEMDKYPPHSQVDHVLPMFKFIAFIQLHTSSKDARMMLFDAENNEGRAKEMCDTLLSKNAPELSENFMKAFYIIREFYDEYRDVAELSLPTT